MSKDFTPVSTKHVEYYTTAINAGKRASVLWEELVEKGSLLKMSKDDQEINFPKYGKVEEEKVHIIIYSGLFLESFINYYAAKHKIQYKSAFEERLSLDFKWIIYPQLAKGQSLKNTSIDLVKSIRGMRDKYVHYKPKRTGKENPTPGMTLEDAINGFNSIKVIMEDLHRIDSSVKCENFTEELDIPKNASYQKSTYNRMI